ncbi:MAG: hypothetical protein RAK25_04230 [TACK group archaeon]|nr:hypothetical protein [TACK group archaeon]
MKNRVMILSVMLLLVTSVGVYPALGATLNAVIYPKQNAAKVSYTVVRSFNLTYPGNTFLSQLLNGKSSSEEVTSQGGPGNAGPLIASIKAQDPNASLINYTLTYTSTYKGTETYAEEVENLTLTIYVANVTQLNSSRLIVNANWRAFAVRGDWDVISHGLPFNVNPQFPSFLTPSGSLRSIMMGEGLHLGEAKALLDFSEFSQPLTEWNHRYDPFTGITTFTKEYPTNESVLLKATINGQTYSLSYKEDPSAQIQVYGYAVPNGNYLEIVSVPATVYAPYAAVGVVAVAAVLLVLWYRSKRAPNVST